MPTVDADRIAETRVPIHPARRPLEPAGVRPIRRGDRPSRSPRCWRPRRWAATWGHRQPVRFIVGICGATRRSTRSARPLKRGNSYAKAAGALILVCADEGPTNGPRVYAAVDAGAAIAQLTIEAVSRGLIAHPMAGFIADGAREVFASRRGAAAGGVAVGSLGDYAAAPPGDPRTGTAIGCRQQACSTGQGRSTP